MSLLVMIMFLLAICPSLFPQVFAYFLAQQDVSGIFCTFCVLVLEAVISVRTPASFGWEYSLETRLCVLGVHLLLL